MDISLITDLIATLGFPIACVIALGFFVWKIYKRSEVREDSLMASIGECRAINAQAIETIAHYAEKLDTIQSDIQVIKADVNVIMNKQDK